MSRRSPRLRFTEEERAAPELKKAVRKADKRADQMEKAEARIPKKTAKVRTTEVDPKTGKVTISLRFEEIDRKKPPSKLTHALRDAPGDIVLAQVHREIRRVEQDNVGTEGAHKLEDAAETGFRMGRSAYRSHMLKPYRNATRAETKADKANLKALYRESERRNPQFSSNPYSRWQQKRAIQKEYAAAKAGKGASNTVKASEITAKAAKQAAAKTKRAGELIIRYRKGVFIVGGIALVATLLLNVVSSCSIMVQGGVSGIAASAYPCADNDMFAAEAQYAGMEAELQNKLDNYESTHDYDEYRFDLDEIRHDPYVLISILTALRGGEWTIEDVQGDLTMLFEKQYTLTETVKTVVRYLHTAMGEVPCNYTICTVRLKNFNLSHVPVYVMSQEQLSRYAMYMATLGNRPDLFPDSGYIGKYITDEYEDYTVPSEALEDEVFAAIIREAEQYLGYPYVWGGSSPSTSFDCSGFVSWVINHCGWNVGRLGAQGLYNICTRVSRSDAKPGDLVFFTGTYDTPGMSHVGIYVGDQMFIHCGDPIQYASLDTPYWVSHFHSYGRLPGN